MNLRNQFFILGASIFASTLMVTFAFAEEPAGDSAWDQSVAVVHNHRPQDDGQRITNPMIDQPIVNYPAAPAPQPFAPAKAQRAITSNTYSSTAARSYQPSPAPVPMVMPQGAPRVHSHFSLSGIYQSNLQIGGSIGENMRQNPLPDNQVFYARPRN